MCRLTNGHCVRLESGVLCKTGYLAIFIFFCFTVVFVAGSCGLHVVPAAL